MTEGINILDSATIDESITNAQTIKAAASNYLDSQAKVGADPPPPVILNTGAMPEDPLRGNIVDAPS